MTLTVTQQVTSLTLTATYSGNSTILQPVILKEVGASMALQDITDVEIVTPVNGQALTYVNGEWINAAPAGGGDMLKAVFDPTTKNVDAFSMGNFDETATKKIFTGVERSKLASITEIFTTALKNTYDAAVTSLNDLLATGARLITNGEITILSNTSGTNTGDQKEENVIGSALINLTATGTVATLDFVTKVHGYYSLTGAMTLSVTAPTLAVGETVTRTIEIKANGFATTLPTSITDSMVGTYDSAKRNFLAITYCQIDVSTLIRFANLSVK